MIVRQAALDMLYTSARVDGTRAHAIGLADRLVPDHELRPAAHQLAADIAAAAPLAVASIRRTMRQDLVGRFRAAVDHELVEQSRLSQTEDWAEGVQASLQRRTPHFRGR
jgi:enoyl-CoA hydratase/carnithine racemase